MSTIRFPVSIRGNQENPGVPIQSTSSKQSSGSLRFNFPDPNSTKQTQKKTYEELCAPFLRQPFRNAPQPPPPKFTTTTQQKQTQCVQRTNQTKKSVAVKNWSLWTVWNNDLTINTKFCSEKHFIETVRKISRKEPIFEKEQWEDLTLDSFTMFRVAKVMDRDADYCPYDEGFCLEGEWVDLMDGSNEMEGDSYDDEEDREHDEKFKTRVIERGPESYKLCAVGCLAEILATVVECEDILIISGGTFSEFSMQMTPVILNCDPENVTQILRIPAYQFHELNMVEIIEPVKEKHRYVFIYSARYGKTVREVTTHRIFKYKQFGKNALDSLAYDDKRWDFPVPVVEETALSIYDSLISPNFTMFKRRETNIPVPRQRNVKKLEVKRNANAINRHREQESEHYRYNCLEYLCIFATVLILTPLLVFIFCNLKNVQPNW